MKYTVNNISENDFDLIEINTKLSYLSIKIMNKQKILQDSSCKISFFGV